MSFTEEKIGVYQLLDDLSGRFQIVFEWDEINRKLLVSAADQFEFSGIIIDSLSGESVIGAFLIAGNRFLGITNTDGYFKIYLRLQIHCSRYIISDTSNEIYL